MMSKLVSKGGHNWDQLLGPVLFAYRTTPHISSGESPFYLVYGRDARIPSSLSFDAPVVKYHTIETEYGRALFKELQTTREVAQKTIGKAQQIQKHNYDKKATDSHLEEGGLCMLKVEPRFRLDRSYRGPFRIQSLTTTNAVITPVNNCNGEPINVSRQRLSRASPLVEAGKPWLGHSGKLRRRRQIRRTTSNHSRADPVDGTPPQVEQSTQVTTRHGRRLRKPARFLLVTDLTAGQNKEGEVVELEESRETTDT